MFSSVSMYPSVPTMNSENLLYIVCKLSDIPDCILRDSEQAWAPALRALRILFHFFKMTSTYCVRKTTKQISTYVFFFLKKKEAMFRKGTGEINAFTTETMMRGRSIVYSWGSSRKMTSRAKSLSCRLHKDWCLGTAQVTLVAELHCISRHNVRASRRVFSMFGFI